MSFPLLSLSPLLALSALPHWRGALVTAGVGVIYLIILILVRWNMLGIPLQRQLGIHIAGLRSRLPTDKEIEASVGTYQDKSDRKRMIAHARTTLDQSDTLLKSLKFWDQILWSRRAEVVAWGEIHEIEVDLVETMPVPEVEAQLIYVESKLRRLGRQSSGARTMADRIQCALQEWKGEEESRVLLQSALKLYDESQFEDLDLSLNWNNKAMWLVTCGLLLMVLLATLQGHAILFLFGAIGGFLSRMRQLQRLGGDARRLQLNALANWTLLFWSPVLGAVTGWVGVLLVSAFAANFPEIFGTAFRQLNWNDVLSPLSYGLAVLFGFSERLFDSISAAIERRAVGSEQTAVNEAPSQSSSTETAAQESTTPYDGPATRKPVGERLHIGRNPTQMH